MSNGSSAIYTIAPSGEWDRCEADLLWSGMKGSDIGADYDAFCPLAGHPDRLCASSSAERTIDVYALSVQKPHLEKLASTPVDHAYNSVRSFTVAGEPWLVAYEKEAGLLDFFRVDKDFSLRPTCSYSRAYGDTTRGYTAVHPFSYRGDMRLLAYCSDDGRAAVYRLSVTADEPLRVAPAWNAKWAEGWTRFSLFRLGGENYFLKTNTIYKSVYIDHLADEAAEGSHPVGRHLPLPIDLTATCTFEMAGCLYIGTYRAEGAATVNRLRSDCQGWDTACRFEAVESAAHLVPLEADGTACLFLY